MAKDRSKHLRTEDGKDFFHFVCVGCDAEGELGLASDDYRPFGCPAGCGSTYLHYRGDGGHKLVAVVAPVRSDAP